MYTDPKILDILVAWVEETSKIIDNYLELTAPFLLEKPRIDPKHQFVLKNLAISCNFTSQSALVLVANGSLWEAEMLIRSVLEGSLRYSFLCVGDNSDELKLKVEEYWEDLFEIARIREHQKTLHFLSLVGTEDSQNWKPITDKLIPQKELEELQRKYPKKLRQSLEQKWSFNQIIQTLAKINPKQFDALSGLASNYSLGSHFIHQDSFAVQIIWDRNTREAKRKSSLELAHGGRLCSDLLTMASLRAAMTFKLHNANREPIKQLQETEKGLLEKLHNAYNSWFDIEYGLSM